MALWNFEASHNYKKTNLDDTTVRRRELSQEAVDKMIYDILSSDSGLAALAAGENITGGHSSAAKSLMAQDLMTKIAGEIALITAPEITERDSVQREDTKNAKAQSRAISVVCTEMNRQGLLSDELYFHPRCQEHFKALPKEVVSGYLIWGWPLASYLARNIRLSRILAPIAINRYEMIATGKWNFWGWVTISLAQPVCGFIGSLMNLRKSHVNVY